MRSPIVNPASLQEILDEPNTLIFDCRHDLFKPEAGLASYREGHIPGAYHLHLDRDLSGPIIPGKTGRHPLPEPQVFADLLSRYQLVPGKEVIAYDDKGGGIAARLWWMLRAIGHERVRVLNGGFPAWKAAGYPTEAGDLPLPDSDYRRQASPYSVPSYLLPTSGRAKMATPTSEHTMVDSRTAERYRGEFEPVDPIAGHIPGAVNLTWTGNLAADGQFLSRDQLKIRFAALSACLDSSFRSNFGDFQPSQRYQNPHLAPAKLRFCCLGRSENHSKSTRNPKPKQALNDKADHLTFYCGSGVTACHNILALEYAYGKTASLYPGSWSEFLIELG